MASPWGSTPNRRMREKADDAYYHVR